MQSGKPPTPDGPDPVMGDDPGDLRREILRLRDMHLGASARAEVLDDRVAELEAQVEELAGANAHLHAELARNPVVRVARAVLRRLRRP